MVHFLIKSESDKKGCLPTMDLPIYSVVEDDLVTVPPFRIYGLKLPYLLAQDIHIAPDNGSSLSG